MGEGKGSETNPKLGYHPVAYDEEDMFASTPEVDNNDNDQGHHHMSEDVNIESNWGSDVLADGHKLENEAICNSGDGTENRGKSDAYCAEKTVERGGGEIGGEKTVEGGVERGKGSRRFHQKVVPVNRSARGSTTDLVPSRVTRSSSRSSCN